MEDRMEEVQVGVKEVVELALARWAAVAAVEGGTVVARWAAVLVGKGAGQKAARLVGSLGVRRSMAAAAGRWAGPECRSASAAD